MGTKACVRRIRNAERLWNTGGRYRDARPENLPGRTWWMPSYRTNCRTTLELRTRQLLYAVDPKRPVEKLTALPWPVFQELGNQTELEIWTRSNVSNFGVAMESNGSGLNRIESNRIESSSIGFVVYLLQEIPILEKITNDTRISQDRFQLLCNM
jgi:hypothetical protein